MIYLIFELDKTHLLVEVSGKLQLYLSTIIWSFVVFKNAIAFTSRIGSIHRPFSTIGEA